jgi:hypothetical protein
MAFRRIVLTGDRIKETEEDVKRLFSTDVFKRNYAGLKTSIKQGAKADTIVVDINGEGADTVAKKVKDVGNKFKVKSVIKTEKPMSATSESKITKSALKEMIKKELTESLFKIDPDLAFKIYDILKTKYPEIGMDFSASSFLMFLNNEL